jgi:hypothetical protein
MADDVIFKGDTTQFILDILNDLLPFMFDDQLIVQNIFEYEYITAYGPEFISAYDINNALNEFQDRGWLQWYQLDNLLHVKRFRQPHDKNIE